MERLFRAGRWRVTPVRERFEKRLGRQAVGGESPSVARTRRRLTGVLALFSCWASLAHAAAERRSVRESCPQALIHEVNPARLEWAYWIAAGAVRGQDAPWSAVGGIGAELTLGVLTYRGFPATGGPWAGRGEVRIGPWLAAATRREGGLLEGGPKLHLGGIYPPSWGTFDLRLGAGLGAFAEGRAANLSATMLWGTRGVLGRHTARSPCSPRAAPRDWAEASVLRLFVSHRRTIDAPIDSETAVGLELSPTLLLPPYSCYRLLGGAP
jgi:hypothetical protein